MRAVIEREKRRRKCKKHVRLLEKLILYYRIEKEKSKDEGKLNGRMPVRKRHFEVN